MAACFRIFPLFSEEVLFINGGINSVICILFSSAQVRDFNFPSPGAEALAETTLLAR